jgi:hypothetical protein
MSIHPDYLNKPYPKEGVIDLKKNPAYSKLLEWDAFNKRVNRWKPSEHLRSQATKTR